MSDANKPVPTAPPVVTSAPVFAADARLAWVNAYQEVQRQTAEAHTAFQRPWPTATRPSCRPPRRAFWASPR